MMMLLDGIHIPLTIPFTRDGESYLRKLEYNVGRYSLTPAAGLVALTGEGAALSDEEMVECLQVIGAAAGREKVLVAAIAKESVRGALTIADEAAAAGFDAVLLAAPTGLTEDEACVFVRAVADRSPLPVILRGLPVEMVAVLARHSNVIGMFDAGLTIERYRAIVASTADVTREVVVTTVFAPVTRRMVLGGGRESEQGDGRLVSAAALAGGAAVLVAAEPAIPIVKTRMKRVGFQVMAEGSARGLIELLEAGVAGAMPGLSACAPQGVYEAYAAFKDGDRGLAAEKEERLLEADRVVLEMEFAGVKYGCDLNGYFGGAPRLPRLPLDADGRLRVERVLAGIRN
jgi:4-hydroxy-2-oxoglutarate aldolase